MRYDYSLFEDSESIEDGYINIYAHHNKKLLVPGRLCSTRESAMEYSQLVKNSLMYGSKKTVYRIRVARKNVD